MTSVKLEEEGDTDELTDCEYKGGFMEYTDEDGMIFTDDDGMICTDDGVMVDVSWAL